MARPIKDGLNYFPLDVDIFDDEKVIPISSEFGAKGDCIVIRVLCAIFRDGYFIECSEAFKFKIAKQSGLPANLVTEVIVRLVKWGFFDKTVFNSFSILTSKGIQRRWLEGTRRRAKKGKLLYWLLNDDVLVSVEDRDKLTAETPLNHTETPLNHTESTQIKAKQIKVKEKKEKEIKTSNQEDICLTDFLYNFSCKDKKSGLTKNEVDELVLKYPKIDVLTYLNSFAKYCESGGEKIPLSTNLKAVIDKSLAKKVAELEVEDYGYRSPYKHLQKVF